MTEVLTKEQNLTNVFKYISFLKILLNAKTRQHLQDITKGKY